MVLWADLENWDAMYSKFCFNLCIILQGGNQNRRYIFVILFIVDLVIDFTIHIAYLMCTTNSYFPCCCLGVIIKVILSLSHSCHRIDASPLGHKKK